MPPDDKTQQHKQINANRTNKRFGTYDPPPPQWDALLMLPKAVAGFVDSCLFEIFTYNVVGPFVLSVLVKVFENSQQLLLQIPKTRNRTFRLKLKMLMQR